jgi:hypothetical protein
MFDPGEINFEASDICPKDVFPAKSIKENISDEKGNTPAECFSFLLR